jgi:tetratricopeptide (TPR) repeat protein
LIGRIGRIRPIGLIFLLIGSAGCRGPGGGSDTGPFPGAPIILISVDTLRSDHLPAYGYKGVTTPAIDALRQDAVLYERAYSHYPMTFPSHASILSGELPDRHGVRDNSGYTFDAARHTSLPRLLHDAGYATAAAVSSFVLRRATGLAAGFDLYDDGTPAGGETPEQRSGADTVERALAWVGEQGLAGSGKPFFLFVHLYEPHTPYEPPQPFAVQYAERPYDGEIATADAAVGRLLAELKRLGIYDQAVVLLLSDHGEGLGEHGEEQHGFFLYRETLQVPLLLKLPGGRRAGTSVSAPAQLVDVVPTLLGLAGVKVPPGLPGRSLLALPGPGEPARPIYAETFFPRLHYGWSELASVIEDRYHYIHGPAPELFDLAADPGETRSVLDRERRAYAALRQAVEAHDRTLAAPSPVDAETAGKLAALGYAGRPRFGLGDAARPDPRTKRAVLRDLKAAKDEVAEERYAAAVDILRRLDREEPGLLDVQAFLAACYERLGQPAERLAAAERALELSGGDPDYALPVAESFFALGRLDEARRHAELAVESSPASANGLLASVALLRHDTDEALARLRKGGRVSDSFRRDLGRALSTAGRTEEALEVLRPVAGGAAPNAFDALATQAMTLSDAGRQDEAAAILERALAADPRNARAHELLGVVSLRRQRPQEARAHLEQALAIDRRLPSAWNTLGVALYDLEGPAAAVAAWQQAVALDGSQYEALLNIGLVSAQAGRRDQAREALRRFVITAPPARFGADIAKARQLLKEIGG